MKFLKKFEGLYQRYGLVGKPDQSVHYPRFAGMAVWGVCFVLVGSHSSELRIDHRLFFRFLTLLGRF